MTQRHPSLAVIVVSTLLTTACGRVADTGAPRQEAKATHASTSSALVSLDSAAMWEGTLQKVVADDAGAAPRFVLTGSYSFTVDADRPVRLHKSVGAAACAAEDVRISQPQFLVRAANGSGDEASSGTLARGDQLIPLGTLPAGAYTLAFSIEADAECSIALGFAAES